MKIIQAAVVRVDNFSYPQGCLQTKDISCDNTNVVGMKWMVPLYNNSVFQEWQTNLENTKPTPDSIRVVVVQTLNPEKHTYYIAVDDAAVPSVFTDLCNACCGATPSAPAYTLPVPIVQDCPCTDPATGNYLFTWVVPNNPNGLNIVLSGIFNGAVVTPVPTGGGYANIAAILTWVQANWAAYGTWTSVGQALKLSATSTQAKCAGVGFALVPATYCFTYPSGSSTMTADSIVIQTNATGPVTVVTKFIGGSITFSNTNTGPLLFALSALMPGVFAVNPGVTNKLNYTGLLVPVKLQLAGVDVAGGGFVSGICQNVYNFAIPSNPSSFNYFITADTFNGVAGTPVPLVGGWASTGSMLTWLNANWSAYGVWTISGSNVVLTGAGTYSAVVTIAVHA